MLSVVQDVDGRSEGTLDGGGEGAAVDLDELCRLAAREMIAVALEAERRAYLEAHAQEVDANGRRLVVGNGYAREREVTTAAGRVEVKAPRVHDRRDGQAFSSVILPPYMRRSPKVTEVLPLLYLRGLSTGDFAPALEGFFGSDQGLSASTVQRLTEGWPAEQDPVGPTAAERRGLRLRLGRRSVHERAAARRRRPPGPAVPAGDRRVRPDGTKELVAVADGHREDTESWLDVLRDLRERGMRAPALAVGDGALGFWGALRQVFPGTREQRCWVHKVANCLAALPKRLHADAKAALARIYTADTRATAIDAAAAYAEQFSAHPKATAKITNGLDVLLAFYDFPAEHWKHLRSTNAIESTFATVRLRQRVTKVPGCRAAGMAMRF